MRTNQAAGMSSSFFNNFIRSFDEGFLYCIYVISSHFSYFFHISIYYLMIRWRHVLAYVEIVHEADALFDGDCSAFDWCETIAVHKVEKELIRVVQKRCIGLRISRNIFK